MAINNNFYATVNDLIERASGGTATKVVDYASFIDAGKALSEMTQGDRDKFMNSFAMEIANKVKLSIDTARDYVPKLDTLVRGQLSPNGVIEMITHGFFSTRAAQFATLTNDGTVDQYVINKGAQEVNYYINDNAYQIPVTIQYLELEGAFTSPEKMDMFLQNKIKYAMNTNALAREQGRRGLLADLIVELDAKTAATGPDTSAQKYELVSLYNTTYGLTGADALTSENALYSSEFVKFAIAMIKKVNKKISDVSVKFNSEGVKTFTPDTAEDKKLITNDALDAAIVAFKSTISPDATELGEHESVSYWQDELMPFVVKTGGTQGDGSVSGETVSSPVVAILYDRFAIGEYLCHEAVRTTPFNAAGEYYNNWINVQTKYCRNKNANAVIFTLD